MENIIEELKKIVAVLVEKNPNKINTNIKLTKDLGMDSLAIIELTIAIEKKYKIEIPEESLTKDITLNQVANLIKELLLRKNSETINE